MIAYVHIGTPKTGTTTIQNFLFNQDKIKKYGFTILKILYQNNNIGH